MVSLDQQIKLVNLNSYTSGVATKQGIKIFAPVWRKWLCCNGTEELLRGILSSQLSVWLTLRPMLAFASQHNIITVEVSETLKQTPAHRDLPIPG